MKRLKKSLLIPLLLALLPAIVIIMLLPPVFEKYEITETARHIKEKQKCWVTYYDIDADGKNELIKTIDTEIGKAAIMVFKSNGKLISQYNYPGAFVERNRKIVFGDFNNDSIAEMYFFTRRYDSVFMQLLSVNNHTDPLLKEEYFIDLAAMTKDSTYDVGASVHSLVNLNNTPEKEILFDIRGYYSIFPRKFGVLDIQKHKITLSKNFSSKMSYIKLLKTGCSYRYLCVANSSANIDDPNTYIGSDMKDELFLLDEKLNVITGPVVYGHYRSYGYIKRLSEENLILTGYASHQRHNDSIFVEYKLFDKNLKLVSETTHKIPNKHRQFVFLDAGNNPAFIADDKAFIIDDRALKIIEIKKIDLLLSTLDLQVNIDNDEPKELLSIGHYKLALMDEDLSTLAIHDIDFKKEQNTFFDVVPCSQKKLLLIQNEEEYSILEIKENIFYGARIPFYLVIYLLSFAFTYLIFYLSKKNSEKKVALKRELASLQLQSTRNQASPHFTFNLLNTISAAILSEDKEKAQSMVSSMGQLMRSSLEYSEKVERSLDEELGFVENYLQLEKQRYNHKLDYKIEIDPEVDTSLPIPKMLLQIFVENAIKHGIKLLDNRKGVIIIHLKNTRDAIKISIEDNGVGREFAYKNGQNSTKTGLKIADKIIKLHKKLNDYDIQYEIEDLFDENKKPKGTKIIITIPQKT